MLMEMGQSTIESSRTRSEKASVVVDMRGWMFSMAKKLILKILKTAVYATAHGI